ncbi:arylamine N-acetyltransferase, pineal gland isozyme NAT-10-like isoform X1 [Acipenser oxyrinchus oxyrinchus]|uniref:arylamine N-acetyltransferase n=1 Tax=Acipenser oxyrinchus oxyrinchus TaxID=40147 RepID=A0AAD8D6U2_ACIOX|nr:arylamine N-acetyltransferase, pineal gland isozyme NAT-10-like isoform X1 [Acipenser oxyrinchus oxyrinchus]
MNLTEYFARIGYTEPNYKADLKTLTELHEHHIRSIPFENLSIHCGEKITLDLETIYNKLVRNKRGGLCYENNQLFSWVLKEMGYDVTYLGAKEPGLLPNCVESHLFIKVLIDGKPYIADVGYGIFWQIWQPLELISGKDQPQLPGVFRLDEDKGVWNLQKTGRRSDVPNESFGGSSILANSLFKVVYSFTLVPRQIKDFTELFTFLQTSPESLFANKSICSLQTTTGFRGLIGWTYCEVTYNYQEGFDLVDVSTVPDEEVEKVLEEKFGVVLENKLVSVNNKIHH